MKCPGDPDPAPCLCSEGTWILTGKVYQLEVMLKQLRTSRGKAARQLPHMALPGCLRGGQQEQVVSTPIPSVLGGHPALDLM